MKKLFLKYDYDLLKITWAHAVNNKSQLSEILKTNVDCIETDITYCYHDGIIYNSHPPMYKSDTTFTEFWEIAKLSNKIFKLDFKMIEAIEPCLKTIDLNDFSRIILNADILKSSNSKVESVNAMEFLKLCDRFAMKSIISIGWTTVKQNKIGYTWEDVYNMCLVIKQIMRQNKEQVITFPVDVYMLNLNSIPKLFWLLEQFSDSSLTIWSYNNVEINVNCLIIARRLFKKTEIFLDLPQLTKIDKDRILVIQPDSDFFDLKLDINIKGDQFWKSNYSYVVGHKTRAEIEMKITKIIQFFIIFDNLLSNNEDGDSECILFASTNMHDSINITFTKQGIKSQLKQCDENIIRRSDEEVYYVLLEYEPTCKLSVAVVKHYNTSSISCNIISDLSLMVDPLIKMVINTTSVNGSFVVVDFVNNYYSTINRLIK